MPSAELFVAQALVRFLGAQRIERDGRRERFFAGVFGIFGHGNVAGLGQALQQYADELPYHPARNEQAMVHIALGLARQRNRLGTFACTSSVGPGATNMVTGRGPGHDQPPPGAASARRHVLHAKTTPGPAAARGARDATVSVNDCFRPVSRFYERVERPEQLIPAALEAMRVLADPAETGAVTLALPEDVQAEGQQAGPAAFPSPGSGRSTASHRPGRPSSARLEMIRGAQGATVARGRRRASSMSDATAALRALVDATGHPVV